MMVDIEVLMVELAGKVPDDVNDDDDNYNDNA